MKVNHGSKVCFGAELENACSDDAGSKGKGWRQVTNESGESWEKTGKQWEAVNQRRVSGWSQKGELTHMEEGEGDLASSIEDEDEEAEMEEKKKMCWWANGSDE